MHLKTRSLRRNKKAVSPAVSVTVITAATIVLVLVASGFALQVLERQKGANEFDTVQKSLLTFDDAFRDVAFDRGGSRSVRFTTDYGYMSLVPDRDPLTIAISAGLYSETFSAIDVGGLVKYSLPTSYVTYGTGYSSFVLGNSDPAVTSASDSLGRIAVSQPSDYLTLTLDYRVRVTYEGPAISVHSGTTSELVNYVNILVVRMNIVKLLNLHEDFDLVARNLNIETETKMSESGTTFDSCSVKVGESEPIHLTFSSPGRVVFNLIIADVEVSS